MNTTTPHISDLAIKYFASKYCKNDVNIVKNIPFGYPYKLKFISHYILHERMKKIRKDGVGLDVLFVHNTNQISTQMLSDIIKYFDILNEILYNKKHNSFSISNCIIEFKNIHRLPLYYAYSDAPDLIIFDLDTYPNNFYDKTLGILRGKRRDGTAMVKSVLFNTTLLNLDEIQTLYNTSKYDLNNMNDKEYQRKLREQKLKNILKQFNSNNLHN